MKITKIEDCAKTDYAYDISVNSSNHTICINDSMIVHNSLRIPKQFLGCLRGNTEIQLKNGEIHTIEEIFRNNLLYKNAEILCCDETGKVKTTRIFIVLLTKPSATCIRLHLSNDNYVDVTEDHKMMLRDGTFKYAKDINIGDRLMPYETLVQYDKVYTLNLNDLTYYHDNEIIPNVVEPTVKVIEIENLDVVEPAYDINVESSCHTFPLVCGIFVHNCTDDNSGFDGGTSLSLISSRYAKAIKRIQNVVVQALTDAINLMLIDKGLDSYINKFSLRMTAPATKEEDVRRDAVQKQISNIRDIMDLLSDIENPTTKLSILKSLLSTVVTEHDVMQYIQDEIDRLTAEAESSTEGGGEDDFGTDDDLPFGGPDMPSHSDHGSPFDDFEKPSFDNEPNGIEEPTSEPEGNGVETMTKLPKPSDLGMDFTDNTQF